MPSVTVNPVSIVSDSGSWTPSTGTDKVALVADNTDGTYLTDGALGTGLKRIVFGMSAASLPDGAALQSVTPTLRASQATGAEPMTGQAVSSGFYSGAQQAFVPTSSPANFVVGAAGAYNADVAGATAKDAGDAIVVVVTSAYGVLGEDHRLIKVSAAVSYVRPPVSSALSIAAGQLTSTTRPQHTFTYTSLDGVPQYEIRAVTWLVSDLANYPGGQAAFEADPDAPFGMKTASATNLTGGATDPNPGSGPGFLVGATQYRARAWTVDSSGYAGWKITGDQTWTPDQDLPNTGAMKTYLRVAATYAGARLYTRLVAGVTSLAFTMNAPPPAAPTSVTSVWQYPSAALVGNRNDQYRAAVSVALPSDTASRRVFVEHSPDGTRWNLLPLGLQTATSGAQTLTFYDTAASPGRPMTYRARTANLVNPLYGPYVTQAGTTTAVFDTFVLRDPLDPAGAVSLRVQGDLESSADEILGESRGLGSALPTFVSDAITGERWPIELITPDETAFLALTALRAKRTTMILQQDMDGYWDWVRFGERWSTTLLRTISRRNASQRARRITADLVETWPLAGQPLPSMWS